MMSKKSAGLLAYRVNDGLPQSLEACIRVYGLRSDNVSERLAVYPEIIRAHLVRGRVIAGNPIILRNGRRSALAG